MFLNIVFFSCVCLFVPCVYVIKIIIIDVYSRLTCLYNIIIIIIFIRINNYMYMVLIKHYAQNYNYIKTKQI